ncbi:AI-2E family transporter [Sphingomonas quercus]|uniref:AI-2E family transporter n=1 Tax=Sphingomonas quercus TaxID=2842451 RepID=A0ABS6BIM0_9SPHN|nr:AI-2E family transporter [Sphingomonas quercus]MBU3078158.1 AI-2E family transporter [Sphingomonas quercus]
MSVKRPGEKVGPTEVQDPLVRDEIKRAAVWLGLATTIVLIWFLAQPILLIVGGLVFATMLDGGTRLLGRALPVARGWRLAIVAIGALAFIAGAFWMTGLELVNQFEALKTVVQGQLEQMGRWAGSLGLVPAGGGAEAISRQLMGSLGQLTNAVGTALGAISSLAMIVVLGLFIAVEPRLYERGLAWMVPLANRQRFYRTIDEMAFTLRRLMAGRLLGMAFEGVFMWVALSFIGVPMALALGFLTGILAFLPNIGAIVSGVLVVLVGFSAGTDTGLWAIGAYLAVQIFDGYIVVPTVARRSVDLAPALVLGAQLLFGALFGILGLALADPIVAMIKVALERRSAALAADGAGEA